MKILVLNAGSSTQKSCLYDLTGDTLPQAPPKPIWKGDIDWTIATDHGLLEIKANGVEKKLNLSADDHLKGMSQMLDSLVQGETKVIDDLSEIEIVGHRVVHGGLNYTQATLITQEVKQTIADLIPLAPTHNPAHLEGIETVEKLLGNVPQLAVFDTAFHSTLPLEVAAYPLPYEWLEKGLRRYGFHGISHQYCVHRAAELLGKPLNSLKLINCHLGNGCSLAAVKDGISINTTMGFTPLEGLMMGSRSGSIDPEIPIFLIRDHGFTPEDVITVLNKKSGLKGVSGVSSDLRAIQKAIQEGNEKAQLAFKMYIHRLRFYIGAMLASLGGLDALIFTAGVGENSSEVREQACEAFGFLGLKLDQAKNESRPVDEDIATPDSKVRVLVIHTEEDWAIAKECWHQLTQK
ncbi:acetate kinase [Gloeothece citriformis PCC 7424]|uniref:Acetate kinase n=1 Tax=Gloeothece citriformis (strain PCC 7424) TaxID=65393 RepID=ACKA_GLOC7|nr:acetate kinase [Gloeothece citriformis]B7KGG9.1 RecName: Full=Acetate kinase; AltName: Full=Acetokinase [Gloeothece citriformis PCC 7424]ACK71896.1 acetate kinase [Gloeothece citriformis PCC 7424]